jgi:hypothetical protein
LSRALVRGSRLNCWKTKPMRRLRIEASASPPRPSTSAGARQQVELLEDEADAAVADRGQRVAAQALDLLAGQPQRARGRTV